jgi:hypothetical protein
VKRLFSVLALLVIVSVLGFTQFRADLGIDIPWRLGATVTNAVGESETESLGVLSEITILLPEAMLAYEARLGPVNLGVGARVFTFIIESLAYPAAFAEVELGPVALNLNVGGGAFLFFGLYNHLGTASLFIPDLSAHLMLGKSLRVGLGGATLAGRVIEDAFPFIVYFSGKFVIRP